MLRWFSCCERGCFFGWGSCSDSCFPEALFGTSSISSEQPLKGQSALLIVNSEHFGRVLLKACENRGLVGKIISSERLLGEPEMFLEAQVIVSACGVPVLFER